MFESYDWMCILVFFLCLYEPGSMQTEQNVRIYFIDHSVLRISHNGVELRYHESELDEACTFVPWCVPASTRCVRNGLVANVTKLVLALFSSTRFCPSNEARSKPIRQPGAAKVERNIAQCLLFKVKYSLDGLTTP